MSSKTGTPDSPEKPVASTFEGGKGATAVVSYEGHVDEEKGPARAAMGYDQQLKRNLSMLTALGLGASIIAAPFGLSTSAVFSLTTGAN